MKQKLFLIGAFCLFSYFGRTEALPYCCPNEAEFNEFFLDIDNAHESKHAQISGEWTMVNKNGSTNSEKWVINPDGTFVRKSALWIVEGHWTMEDDDTVISFSFQDDDGSHIEDIDLTIVDIDYHTAALANSQKPEQSVIYLTKG